MLEAGHEFSEADEREMSDYLSKTNHFVHQLTWIDSQERLVNPTFEAPISSADSTQGKLFSKEAVNLDWHATGIHGEAPQGVEPHYAR